MSRLRILALHGYHGSAEILRGQMRPLARVLDPVADVVAVDAPSLAAGDFGWWHAVPDDHAPAGSSRRRYRGWSRTRDWLQALCAEQGPFDGVFGFSQGAALAALLVAMCALDPHGAGRHARLGFAIVVGGFPSNDARHAHLFEAPGGIAVPSLHIIGQRDTIVPSGTSRALAARFAAPVIVEHDGGHVIADTPEVRDATARFLDGMAPRRGTLHAGPDHAPATASVLPRSSMPPRPLELPLWSGRAHPAMRIHFPDDDRSRARPVMLVFRGGGYTRCDGSGAGSAAWLARQGMIGIEVEYGTRATRAVHPAAYADAARAVRLVRHFARDWGIDPTRVGILGYSAGGHLASLLSTQPTRWVSPDDDLAAQVSARPDLVVLAYPLISFVEQYTPGAFAGSVENFFGHGDVSESLRRQVSNELHVTPDHPPVFLWTTADDAIVPAAHTERFAEACRRAHVPIELTIYPHGPHGMGLALDQPGDVGTWTTKLLAWLDRQWGPR
jgi:acetyl esterase/lipase